MPHSSLAIEQPEAFAIRRAIHHAELGAAILELVHRGWLEADTVPGRYRPTATGNVLRDEVEARTDLYFYQPWSVLTDDEWDDLVTRQSTLRMRFRELRRAAREAASRS